MKSQNIFKFLTVFLSLFLFYACRSEKKNAVQTTPSSVIADSLEPIPHLSINENASFVAGLSVKNKNSKLYALTQTKAWKNHARNMDQIWNAHLQNAPKYLTFTQTELSDINQDCHTLFYPFGGPDFLFAHTFFPNMNTYFLIGLERTGQEIQVKHPSDKTYKLYQDAVSDVLSLSFFPTKNMNIEQENDTIDGVVPVISMLMARMAHQIISIKNVRLDEKGNISDHLTNGTPISEPTGLIEIRFFRSGTHKVQTLYYYATDLSNDGLAKNKPLIAYINNLDQQTTATFIKSASYLMHEDAFSTIRDLILSRSASIIQDDSGIPLSFYSKNTWDKQLYGTFYKPVSAYAEYSQPVLRDAYQLGSPMPLNFRIGFARQSNLQIFRRK